MFNLCIHDFCFEIADCTSVLTLIMEQLQLQVEVRLFDQDEGRLAEMMGTPGIEDDVVGKTKMQLIKIIRKELDSKMESDEKTAQTCLEQLLAYVMNVILAKALHSEIL